MTDSFCTLAPEDVRACVLRIPASVQSAMYGHRSRLVIAGGFIRSVIAREEINDLDLFVDRVDRGRAIAEEIAGPDGSIFESQNALSIGGKPPIQVITRWTFDSPRAVVRSFDFTVARAAIWFDGRKWCSVADHRYYQDLAAKRLIYMSPVRNEDAGGSMLRVLKFYKRNYLIPVDSLGAVMARMAAALPPVALRGKGTDRERRIAAELTALLKEVDPQVDPDHFAHLPAEKFKAVQERRAGKQGQPRWTKSRRLASTRGNP